MSEVTGMVSQLGQVQSYGGTSFRVEGDEKWYSVYQAAQLNSAQVGQSVSFRYTEKSKGDKTFYNVQGNVQVDGQSGGGNKTPPPTASASLAPKLDKNRLIVRQNALNNSTGFCIAKGDNVTVEQVISVAKAFEAYTSGDADEKESEKDSDEPNWQEAAGKLRAAS
jgi:hypothetical protein